MEAKEKKALEEAKAREAAPTPEEGTEGADRPKTGESKSRPAGQESKLTLGTQESKKEDSVDELEAQFAGVAQLSPEEEVFEEFLAQVNFKRTTEIEGYSETKIDLTFTPFK